MVISIDRGWSQEDVLRDFTITVHGMLLWNTLSRKGKPAGWTNDGGYTYVRYKGILVGVHNIVWLMTHGVWPTREVDHIDNRPWNNLSSNLRLSDRKGQGANQSLQKRRLGKYKGVHQSSSGNYYVKIKRSKKQYYKGTFCCEIDAAEAYNQLAVELFGEFANLNVIPNLDKDPYGTT